MKEITNMSNKSSWYYAGKYGRHIYQNTATDTITVEWGDQEISLHPLDWALVISVIKDKVGL